MPEQSRPPDAAGIVRRAIEAVNRRDFEAATTAWLPGGVLETPTGLGTCRGREAIAGFLEDWLSPYEDLEMRVDEFRELGDGVSLTRIGQRGRLRGSGGVVEVRGGIHVAIWRDGLIECNTIYSDAEEGRVAAERLAEERG